MSSQFWQAGEINLKRKRKVHSTVSREIIDATLRKSLMKASENVVL